VLISAGLFAAQRLNDHLRHKHRASDANLAANANGGMRVASHAANEGQDDSAGPVSVSSRFQHVLAPPEHAKKRSTHAVAVDEQLALEDSPAQSSEAHQGAPAAKPHHRETSSHAVQHAADDSESLQLGDLDGPSPPADHPTRAATGSGNHDLSQREAAPHVTPVPAAQSAKAETIAPASDHAGVQSNVSHGPATGLQAAAQPTATILDQGSDPAKWPLVPSTAPASGVPAPAASGAVQVSAEGSNASTPTLTIVPGRPDTLSLPDGAHPPRTKPTFPQQVINFPPAPSADASTVHPGQSPNVYNVAQDRPEVAASAQSAPNPLEALDRTKVMSFQFRNAPWPLVLANFAKAMGLELRMQAMPEGNFNRWDLARYTPTQTLAILNSELANIGCQARVVGTALYVLPATSGGAAVPAFVPAAITPAAASSSQLP
jgi:hypothetical protein